MLDTQDAAPRLRDALDGFASRNDLSPARVDDTHWYPGRGLLHVRLPNFAWRRRALPHHDAHHLLTGYPCTPSGEMQMAAWEFAAGRYPHAAATAFCLPLVGFGALLLPRRTFAAFVRGRRNRSLYATPFDDRLLDTRIDALQAQFAPQQDACANLRDVVAFARLVAWSLAWSLLPVLAVWALVAVAR